MLFPRGYVFARPGLWGWAGGVVFVLLFALVLGLAVFAFVRYTDRRTTHHHRTAPPPYPPPPPVNDQAVAQARYRYANGQLSREQYFQILADLGAAPPGPAGPPPWWAAIPDATAPMWPGHEPGLGL